MAGTASALTLESRGKASAVGVGAEGGCSADLGGRWCVPAGPPESSVAQRAVLIPLWSFLVPLTPSYYLNTCHVPGSGAAGPHAHGPYILTRASGSAQTNLCAQVVNEEE